MCAESSNEQNRQTEAYAALIKPGDAVETPDGALWVVEAIASTETPMLALTSAYRSSDGRIYADAYDATHTSVPRELVTKVADARQVRR